MAVATRRRALMTAGTTGGHDSGGGGSATVPGAPTTVIARTGTSAQASLSWTAPASNGGASITGYEITPYIGASAQTPILTGSASTSFTVTGLTNGTAYSFAVAAINSVGLGPFSVISNSVTVNAVAFVKSAQGNNSTAATTITATFASPVAAGNLIVIAWGDTGFAFSSASDSLGTTYREAVPSHVAAGFGYTEGIAYGIAPAGGSNTVTVTFTGSATFRRLAILEYAGVDTLDQTVITDGVAANVSPMTSDPFTTTQNGEVLFAWFINNSVYNSAGTGWTQRELVGGEGTQDQVNKAIGTYTATANGGVENWMVGVATFCSGPTVPNAPKNVVATPSSTQASLTWTAPASNGGSAVTGYQITPYVGATPQTPVNTGSTATSFTVTGLTNGTTYTFKIAAINAVGTGAQSAASNAVTPVQPAFVQAASNFISGAGNTITATFPSPVTAGNVIVVCHGNIGFHIQSCADSVGTSYTLDWPIGPNLRNYGGLTGGYNMGIVYGVVAANGSNTVTVTFDSSSPTFRRLVVLEYTGINGIPDHSAITDNVSAGTAMSCAISTTNPHTVIVAWCVSNSTPVTPGSGWTQRGISSGEIAEDKVDNAPGSYTATATGNAADTWTVMAGAFY